MAYSPLAASEDSPAGVSFVVSVNQVTWARTDYTFAYDIKLGGWDCTPKSRASIRRTLLCLRTGPEDTSRGSTVQRPAPGAGKSHGLGSNGRAAALPKSSRHLHCVPGCTGANSAFSLQHGEAHSALHRRGSGKPAVAPDSVLVKLHRLSENCNLDRSPQTYPLSTYCL